MGLTSDAPAAQKIAPAAPAHFEPVMRRVSHASRIRSAAAVAKTMTRNGTQSTPNHL